MCYISSMATLNYQTNSNYLHKDPYKDVKALAYTGLVICALGGAYLLSVHAKMNNFYQQSNPIERTEMIQQAPKHQELSIDDVAKEELALPKNLVQGKHSVGLHYILK